MIGVLAVLLVGAGTHFLLPAIQKLTIPRMPGGPMGPWLIRPIKAFHFGASAICDMVLTALLLIRFRRKRANTDAVRGTPANPANRPMLPKWAAYLPAASLLTLIYLSSLSFYLCSWTAISAAGVEEHLPWGARNYPYVEVRSLETIPAGVRSEALATDGPCDDIVFQNGRVIDFSLENEGLSAAEIKAIEDFIAAKTGKEWKVSSDAQPPQ